MPASCAGDDDSGNAPGKEPSFLPVERVGVDRPGSLYRGQRLVLLGHYRGHGPEQERLWAYGTIRDLGERMKLLGKDADRKQAIVDPDTQYGLVTPYTSVVVLEEQQFQHHGIKHDNRDRVQWEEAARRQPTQQPATNHRVDTARPMFLNQCPSVGGGGSMTAYP